MEQMSEKNTESDNAKEIALAKKLMLIVFTDFLCWVRNIFFYEPFRIHY